MSAQLYNAEIIFCLWYLLPCLRVRGLFEKPTKKTCHCSTFRKTTLIPNLMEEWLKPKFFSLKKSTKNLVILDFSKQNCGVTFMNLWKDTFYWLVYTRRNNPVMHLIGGFCLVGFFSAYIMPLAITVVLFKKQHRVHT